MNGGTRSDVFLTMKWGVELGKVLAAHHPGTGEPDRARAGPRQLNQQVDPPLSKT